MKETDNNLWFYCKYPKCSQVYGNQCQVLEHVEKVHSKSSKSKDDRNHLEDHLFGTLKTIACIVPLTRLTKTDVEKYCSYRKMLSHRGKIAALSRKKKPISHHFSPRPFRCNICPNKAFSLKSSLNNHMLTHGSSSIEHSCTFCGKSFRLISMLNAHKLTHLKMSFSCSFCNRNFKNKYRLAHHLKGLNESEELACSVPDCTMTFKNKSCMLFHHKMNHLPNSSVPKDKNKNRSPRIRTPRSAGVKEVKFTCEECNKIFYYESHYKKHLRKANLNEFEGECQICSLKFTNRACQMYHNKWKHPTEKDEILEEIKSQAITKTDGTYKCKFCHLSFKNFAQLNSHLKTHPKENMYKCNICNKSYRSVWNLKYHRMTHTGIKKFICKAVGCGKYFQNPRTLSTHKKIHLESKFSCSTCSKKFSLKIYLVKHMKNVSDEIVKCTQLNCSGQFKSKNCLNYHLKSVHEIEGLKGIRQSKEKKPEGPRMRYCRYCAKDCVYEKRLELHEFIHTGEKPFKCDFENCTKAFRLPSSLLDHTRTHSEAKTFKCNICNKAYKTKNVYHAHKQTHNLNRLKKFACQFCSKGYFNNDCLRKHLKGMNESIQIPCEICGLVFYNKNCKIHHFKSTHLEAKESYIGDNIIITKNSSNIFCKFCAKSCKYLSQMNRHHVEPGHFNCDYCSSSSFPFKHCLIFHKKTVHQEISIINVEEKEKRKRIEVNKTCEICDKTFKYAHLLRTHMLCHTGERPFICPAQDCSKDFKTSAALKEHRTIHTQEKNYKCKFCDKWFRLSSVRSNHMKNVHKGKRNKFPYSSKTSKSKSKRGKYQRKPKIVDIKPKIEMEPDSEFSILSNFPPSPEPITNPIVIIKEESNHDEIDLDLDPFENLNGDSDSNNIPENVKFQMEICEICQSCFANEKFLHEHKVKCHSGSELLRELLSNI